MGMIGVQPDDKSRDLLPFVNRSLVNVRDKSCAMLLGEPLDVFQ